MAEMEKENDITVSRQLVKQQKCDCKDLNCNFRKKLKEHNGENPVPEEPTGEIQHLLDKDFLIRW